ncbi:hypothetical protein [Lysinibacillus sp. FSL W8-0992]|uniref:hypothetical protein n=1 Tax=Lysinibacillus sp. FSL W8-0992 TaxID=2954643 RepID=UPI0030FC9F12
MNASLNESKRKMDAFNAEKYQREVENHKALLKIADNTKGINELISLVRQGNDINKEAFALLQEMQTIMTAQSPEEAETIFHEVMGKATQAKENIDTLQSLIGYGKMLGKIIFPESTFFD